MVDFVFLDSGIGGIPYMTTLLERDKNACCVYVADSANFPYGEKTHEEVLFCVTNLVQKICNKFSPSVIVLACNTISVNALDTLRIKFPEISFVGTVPAIKLAANVSKKRRIGLLATLATCENPYNTELKDKFASDCKLIKRADPELISFIEHNAFTATREECLKAVKPAVDFFKENDCDVMILGCTHFLNITDIFKEAAGRDLAVVDSVDGVVRHSIEVLKNGKGYCGAQKKAASLYVTGLSDTSEKAQYDEICKRYGLDFKGNI